MDTQSAADAASASSPPPSYGPHKRPVGPGASSPENKRKTPKITRACDLCRVKKARCSGMQPCSSCVRKHLPCAYNAAYTRGRPPTPPPATPTPTATPTPGPPSSSVADAAPSSHEEPDVAEIEGQYFAPTSGLTFLHRAYQRTMSSQRGLGSNVLTEPASDQPITTAGDRPFDVDATLAHIPDRATASELLNYYFESCAVTYRMLHRPTVLSWLESVLSNAEQGLPSAANGLGEARAAVVLVIIAIVTYRRQKISRASSSSNPNTRLDEPSALRLSDPYFLASTSCTSAETGLPRLESAQARLMQVLYLLQTERMNQAWYILGTASHMVLALGLHRRRLGLGAAGGLKRTTHGGAALTPDYMSLQCQRRVFWVAYTIDVYLSVVFGRPRHFHDDDIDQEFPDSVNDEDMTPRGPSDTEPSQDSFLDALIMHAKLAQTIGDISRKVYSIKPGMMSDRDRVQAAHRAVSRLREWRASLPPHLGGANSIRLSSLMPAFRRQATALRLAHSHAVMHATRTFLLGRQSKCGHHRSKSQSRETEDLAEAERDDIEDEVRDSSVAECLGAARVALETVDAMAMASHDPTLFYAFWWTNYVTFCALAVAYVWEIQKWKLQRQQSSSLEEDAARLPELAERCRPHLLTRGTTSTDSLGKRYAVVLEELRLEAQKQRQSRTAVDSIPPPDPQPLPAEQDPTRGAQQQQQQQQEQHLQFSSPSGAFGGGHGMGDEQQYLPEGVGVPFGDMQSLLDDWQTTDWLHLDSSIVMGSGSYPYF